MTDHTLSSLRRRARQTGSIEDQAAVLVAWLRAAPVCERCGGTRRAYMRPQDDATRPCSACAGTGSPFRARLELAAYCGSEAARAVCGPVEAQGWAAVANPGALSLDVWLRGLSRWSDLHPRAPGWVLVRAAVAAARVALAHVMAQEQVCKCGSALRAHDIYSGHAFVHACDDDFPCECGWLEEEAPRRAIEAAEAWLSDPSGHTGPAARRWDDAIMSGVEDAILWLPPPPSMAGPDRVLRSIEGAARLAGESSVREAVCRSLIEWALSEDA